MDEEYKKKIDESLELNKEIFKKVEKIHKHIMLRNTFTLIKIIVIIIPLILAIIYLPPYLEDFFKQYNEFLRSFIKF